MTITSTADIKNAKTSDLVAFYNKHNSQIIKFRDRATAELRCSKLLLDLGYTTHGAPAAPAAQVIAKTNAKTYLGIIRDHSRSMQHITIPAARDYNGTLAAATAASSANSIETILSVIECGGGFRRKETLVPITSVQPMRESDYKAPGHDTPLFDSVNAMIDQFAQLPDANDPEVTFLIVATTDGGDNASGRLAGQLLAQRIKALQRTDRWTVVFRVPRGDARGLTHLGIDQGNILEWDTNERGVGVMAAQNVAAFNDFFTARSLGTKSTKTFYTSVASVTEADVKKLGDISTEINLWPVAVKEEGAAIRDFVEGRLNGSAMLKGAAFYQLVKTEDKIQDYKLIAIRNKETGAVHCGPEARDLIGLPRVGDVRVRPDTAGKWQVFVQSTSVNRKVSAGTQLMYWPKAGAAFKEGVSAR